MKSTLDFNPITILKQNEYGIQNQHTKLHHTVYISIKKFSHRKMTPGDHRQKWSKQIAEGEYIEFEGEGVRVSVRVRERHEMGGR